MHAAEDECEQLPRVGRGERAEKQERGAEEQTRAHHRGRERERAEREHP